jgi:hypothetical protein
MYTRTETTEYVYRSHPSGLAGGTVAATNRGEYKYKRSEEGKVVKDLSGSHAGVFGGEVDQSGQLLQGSTQHVIKEGDQITHEVKGTADPSVFLEKLGLQKPHLLKETPFDVKSSIGQLPNTLDSALEDFECLCDFKGDPLKRRELKALGAAKGQ